MDFLSFSHDYWDGPRHNRHYFLDALSRRARVLFCAPPFHVEKVLRLDERRKLTRSGTFRLGDGLINHVPSKLLFLNHRVPALNQWMRTKRLERIRAVLAQHGMRSPLLILWHPYFRDLIDDFQPPLVIYYAYDQYTGYTGGSTLRASPQEIELLKRADLVFVLSKELYEAKREYSSSIVHLPNAVDFDLFSRSRDAATEVPADLASIAGPRIGYIGTINEKVDLSILEHMARVRPDWSIVLAGRENYRSAERQRFLDLVARPNVHWLGAKPHHLVPSYLKGLDACLMCYVINDWTFYGDPSKLHEYLASGKPTFGCALSSIREFADVVGIPGTPEEWVDAVDAGLRESGDDQRTQRIEIARQNSYAVRIEVFLNAVQDALARKGLGDPALVGQRA
jgi:glycosyltransferase involved in cell wall biosynthesis